MDALNGTRVPRRAKLRRENGSFETQPLAHWRDAAAYVLLGDPGAGKTCSFQAECEASQGLWMTARNIKAGITEPPEGRIVFIDGLDEVRAGANDGRTPFDAIRKWLHNNGRPRFRLSCREADWLGNNDPQRLAEVAPGQAVQVLHLEPLNQDDVLAVLRSRASEVPDPEAFWHQAEQFNLTALFGNPLLLDLTIKAVTGKGGQWPRTRQGVYEAACHQLVTEASGEHKAVQPRDTARLLHDAGLLCAVLLLSHKEAWVAEASGESATVDWSSMPEGFPVVNARAALATKVFTTVAGRCEPRHRSIAEFLAAQALAKLIKEGLPLGRVLAVTAFSDGQPVPSLRGLIAWLAVHSLACRQQLVALDPLGFVLNGDVAAITTSERLKLLQALRQAAKKNPAFKQDVWVSHPFGALATQDMAPTYEEHLRQPHRDDALQAFIECVLDALCHGEPMPTLGPALATWVEDATAWPGNRLKAYRAWKHNVEAALQPGQQMAWLERLHTKTLIDSNDCLTGQLLTDLYPEHIGPHDVLNFFRPPTDSFLSNDPKIFWSQRLLNNSRPQDFAALADAWIALNPAHNETSRELSGKVLAKALAHADQSVTTERLYAWLGICLNEKGSSVLQPVAASNAMRPLLARPEQLKAVLALSYGELPPGEKTLRDFYLAEQRLHGVLRSPSMPRDFLRWLLDLAAQTNDEALAKYCFQQVAPLVFKPPAWFDVPTMEEIEHWVEVQAGARPVVREWLTQSWSSNLDDGWADHHRYERKREAQELQDREERQGGLAPHLASLRANGPLPTAGFLHDLALAAKGHMVGIQGETPVQRVQDFMVTDTATAELALAAIDHVLAREDLPSADEILNLDAEGKYHPIRPAALLAATRRFSEDPHLALSWPDDLAQKMVAFYLTDGKGEMPGCYRQLVAQRPELVAPIFKRYVQVKLKLKKPLFIAGLWELAREAEHRALARRVLPDLLALVPPKASVAVRQQLNQHLLAALHVLDDTQAASIVAQKLAQPRLDPLQCIAWWVAQLPYRAEAAEGLAKLVGKNERRAVALGIALEEQRGLKRTRHAFSPTAVRHLIEVLAPITPHRTGTEAHQYTDSDYREDTIRGLLHALSSNPSPEAREALQSLADSGRLGTWVSSVADAIRRQQAVSREAQFEVAEPAAAAHLLANGPPATAADLQALAIDHLQDLEKKFSGDNANVLKQFWQHKKKPRMPQDENDCRDVLLDQLRQCLHPHNISVDPEASAAQNKRADLRLTFMGTDQRITLPIEVKKDNHDKLWTARGDQLQRLYTNDPATDGLGVYLVLWFNHETRSTPEGEKPRDAPHLRELLLERMPEADQHKLAVCVMDLSWPK